MKPHLIFAASACLGACASSSDGAPASPTVTEEDAALAISPVRLRTHIDTLAAEEMGGRICGSPGHDAAREYVRAQLESAGLAPFGDGGTFVEAYAAVPFDGRYQRQADGTVAPNATDTCQNLVGLLRGSDLADEYVVLVAHYDHLGVTADGEVYNGAFDDASGVAALLEVARALVSSHLAPRRSIVFLVSDQEEQGLLGAKHWLDDPPMPLAQIVAGIAADPVGRGLLPDFAPLVLTGAERSPGFSAFLRETRSLTPRPLGFIHRMMIPIYGSDHDQFFEHGIPAVWLTSPGMSFYHQVDDDAPTIDYAVLRDVSRYLLRAALRLANTAERFSYVGDAPLDLQHAQDTKDLLVGVSGSTVLTADERTQVQGYIADLDRVLASDWSAVGNPLTFFVNALGFVAFQLPRVHPGEIPPPFPNETGAP